jgi:hypothetical protein
VESLRELFVSLGLEWDAAGFAEAIAAEKLLEKGAELLVEAFKEIPRFLGEAIVSTAEYAEQTENAALRTGLTVEAFQELSYAAATSGSSVETFESAMTRLAHKMSAVTEGNQEAALAFGRLGVRVTDGNGHLRDREAVLNDTADALAKIKNPTERAAAAIGIFDRSAVSLIPLLSKGSAGIGKIREEARRLGNVMDEEAIAKAAEFNHSLEAMGFTLKGLMHDFGGPLIEALQPVVDELREWFMLNRELIRSKIQGFVAAVIAGVRALAFVLGKLASVLAWVISNWRTFAVVLGAYALAKVLLMSGALLEQLVAWGLNTAAAVLYGAEVAAAGIKAAAAWVASVAPIVLLTALIAILALAAEDVYGFFTGANSVMGKLGLQWSNFLDSFLVKKADDPWWLLALKAALRTLTDLQGTWERFNRIAFGPRQVGEPHQGLSDVFFPGGAGGPAPAAEKANRGAWEGFRAAQSIPAAKMTANFVIQQQPGQDGKAVASQVRRELDTWWDDRMREAGNSAKGW